MEPNLRFFGNLCNADYMLDEITACHDLLSDLIVSEKSKFKDVQVEFEQNPELYERILHLNFTLENQVRNSTIINLVTFLEIELQQFCLSLQSSLSLKFSYNNFKGTTLDQFKTYTNKVGDLNIDFGTDIWQSIKELVELRNCIVHYDSQIEDWYGRKFSRSKVIDSLNRKFNFVVLTESGHIELTDEAGTKCIKMVKGFIDLIYSAALERFPKTN